MEKIHPAEFVGKRITRFCFVSSSILQIGLEDGTILDIMVWNNTTSEPSIEIRAKKKETIQREEVVEREVVR